MLIPCHTFQRCKVSFVLNFTPTIERVSRFFFANYCLSLGLVILYIERISRYFLRFLIRQFECIGSIDKLKNNQNLWRHYAPNNNIHVDVASILCLLTISCYMHVIIEICDFSVTFHLNLWSIIIYGTFTLVIIVAY